MSAKGVVTFQNAGLTFVGLVTGQTSVLPSATQIVAAEPDRGRLLLINTATNVLVYVGDSTSVTTTSGYPLEPQRYMKWEYTGALYGIVQTTTTIVGFGKLQ